MDPSEVEFLAEKEKISILTNFSENKIYLIGVSFFYKNLSLSLRDMLQFRIDINLKILTFEYLSLPFL